MSRRFGSLLRRYREDNDLTGARLVRELQAKLYTKQYGKADISKWENGKTKPPVNVIEALEEILEVPQGQLVGAASEPYSIHSVNTATNTQQLYEDIVSLAEELEALIYACTPKVIIVPESIKHMVFSKDEVPRPVVLPADNFDNQLRSSPAKLTLYSRFAALETSRGFKNALTHWRRNARYYAELTEYSESPELVEQAYGKAKESANNAIVALWDAVEACRWGDS